MQEEIQGRNQVSCDECHYALKPEEDLLGEHLKADFPGVKGKKVERHFCGFSCLRKFLNKRKKAYGSLKNGVWELEFTPTEEFTQSALWPKK